MNNDYGKALNFWKEKEALSATPREQASGERKMSGQVKVSEKAREIIAKTDYLLNRPSERGLLKRTKPEQKSNKPQQLEEKPPSKEITSANEEAKGRAKPVNVEKLRRVFEKNHKEQPSQASKAAPGKIAIPLAFMTPEEKEIRRKMKGKEKETEAVAEKSIVNVDLTKEAAALSEIEEELYRLNQKLDEKPSLEDLNAIREELSDLEKILSEGNFKLSPEQDDLYLQINNLEEKINRHQEIASKAGESQIDLFLLETNLSQSDSEQLSEELDKILENLALDADVESNHPTELATVEGQISQPLKMMGEESKRFDFKTIEQDIARLKEILKKSPRDLITKISAKGAGLTHSYTVYPDGKIAVHLKKEEWMRIGNELKAGLLGKGGYKRAKLMQNIDTKEIKVRGVLFEPLDEVERVNIIQFIEDVKGQPHICQMEHVAWKSMPKKPVSIWSAQKAGGRKEAFISKYYPFSGEKVFSFIKSNQLHKQLHAKIALQLAQGIQIMHEKGWVHRDLKPENIFLQWDPSNPKAVEAAVGDFDTVHKNSDASKREVSLGTPGYIPPEYSEEEHVKDARPADVYALGVSLLEMFISHGSAPWKVGRDPIPLTFYLTEAGYKEDLEKLKQKAKSDLERLIIEMCDPAPSARPKIEVVVERLQRMQK
ncbi:protein kinase [Neochlamydia sp. AcF95]|uniref:protein kinase domain-containing protein n=1 Tax=Neochlamydia sp. AcF95 TaxID=2795734 RepID=UPI001BCA631D|nr:protein kinase [Neochlamydia sp. AcF95]